MNTKKEKLEQGLFFTKFAQFARFWESLRRIFWQFAHKLKIYGLKSLNCAKYAHFSKFAHFLRTFFSEKINPELEASAEFKSALIQAVRIRPFLWNVVDPGYFKLFHTCYCQKVAFWLFAIQKAAFQKVAFCYLAIAFCFLKYESTLINFYCRFLYLLCSKISLFVNS